MVLLIFKNSYVAVGFCDALKRATGEGMEHCDIVLGWIENFPPYEPRIAVICHYFLHHKRYTSN